MVTGIDQLCSSNKNDVRADQGPCNMNESYPLTQDDILVWRLARTNTNQEYALTCALDACCRSTTEALESLEYSTDWVHRLMHCPDTAQYVTVTYPSASTSLLRHIGIWVAGIRVMTLKQYQYNHMRQNTPTSSRYCVKTSPTT